MRQRPCVTERLVDELAVGGTRPLKCINPLNSELSLHFTEDLAGLCPVGSSGFWRNTAAHEEDLLNRFPRISSQY